MRFKNQRCYIERVQKSSLGDFEYIPVNSAGTQIAEGAASHEAAVRNAEESGYTYIE